jgi:hypothetical protein
MSQQQDFLIDRFIQSLRDAQTELEAFRVQLALGKADAKDKYEELRSDVERLMREWQDYLRSSGIVNEEGQTDYKRALEELRLQASLGKAEAAEFITRNSVELLNYIHELEQKVSADSRWTEFRERWTTGIEVAKTKLEILKLHVSLGKLETEAAFPEAADRAREILDSLSHRFKNADRKVESAIDDIKKAFETIRKG